MNKQELIRRVSAVMKENDIKKPIRSKTTVFHISDDDGNKKDFEVKTKDTRVIFTKDDIEGFIDSFVYVIQNALKRGEAVNIKGLGTFSLNFRKSGVAVHPVTHETVKVAARYLPKFSYSPDLRMCAKIYELSLNDKTALPPPIEEYDEEEE